MRLGQLLLDDPLAHLKHHHSDHDHVMEVDGDVGVDVGDDVDNDDGEGVDDDFVFYAKNQDFILSPDIGGGW